MCNEINHNLVLTLILSYRIEVLRLSSVRLPVTNAITAWSEPRKATAKVALEKGPLRYEVTGIRLLFTTEVRASLIRIW